MGGNVWSRMCEEEAAPDHIADICDARVRMQGWIRIIRTFDAGRDNDAQIQRDLDRRSHAYGSRTCRTYMICKLM